MEELSPGRGVPGASAGQDERDGDGHGGARKPNAAAGDMAVQRIPAMALAARLASAWVVASSPKAEPRKVVGQRPLTRDPRL